MSDMNLKNLHPRWCLASKFAEDEADMASYFDMYQLQEAALAVSMK